MAVLRICDLRPSTTRKLLTLFIDRSFSKGFSCRSAESAWENSSTTAALACGLPVEFPDSAWEASIDLARRFGPTLGVRTLDSLHVACALELKAQTILDLR